ncbi:hypothetical protein [Terrimonas pollutisoli]|uniref:hypothetical protein n=1 Tax=Terrimonas pollutisoli TaxID=3034147 RepID=UPI0023EBBA6A|nr:hypothetical protein [Terrimonas sp. H1YJ31]
MNSTAFRELGTYLFFILLLIAIILYFLRVKKVSLFFLVLSIFIGADLIFSPITYEKETKKHNKEISGVYKLSYVDTTAIFHTMNLKVSDSCKMILSRDEKFRVENCPEFIVDSVGTWTWCSDENYFGVCFMNLNDQPINSLRSDIPYKKIQISKNLFGITRTVLEFTRPE